MTRIDCVGCGVLITRNYNGGGWCYTCPCGAHVFAFDGTTCYPMSIKMALELRVLKQDTKRMKQVEELYPDIPKRLGILPHLEYLFGFSEHTSEAKQKAINECKLAGSISMFECKDQKCIENRTRMQQKLEQALEEDSFLWRMKEEQLAAHFVTPLVRVRELKNSIHH